MATHDYVLDNAAGATFRADANNALAAIVSNNSSASAPSPTFAYMWWNDTTADILKRRNATNSAWVELIHFDETNGLFRIDFDEGADIASAATTDIGAATGNSVTITGTTTITALGSIKAGSWRLVTFADVLTLTHNATSLILPGAVDITTAAGDVMLAESLGSGNWRVPFYQRAAAVLGDFKGADIASATTTDLRAATGDYVDITGTTTITALGTAPAGSEREIQFDGELTLTHNATSLILPGAANITTAAGDVARFRSEGSGNWRCVNYQRSDGQPISGNIVRETEQATTSGTSFDFTGISANAKRITIMFEDVSLDGADSFLVQLGDSGGVETTGYVGTSIVHDSTGGGSGGNTLVGFRIAQPSSAVGISGLMTLINISGDTWIQSHTVKGSTSETVSGGGHKSLSDTLTTVRLTRIASTNFDNGAVNILVEE